MMGQCKNCGAPTQEGFALCVECWEKQAPPRPTAPTRRRTFDALAIAGKVTAGLGALVVVVSIAFAIGGIADVGAPALIPLVTSAGGGFLLVIAGLGAVCLGEIGEAVVNR